MYVKIHISKNSVVTAICDKNLIGKSFSENNKQLDVTEKFFKGEIKTKEEVIEIMKKATNLNLTGKKTIDLALKIKILKKEDIITIKSIPHAQIFVI